MLHNQKLNIKCIYTNRFYCTLFLLVFISTAFLFCNQKQPKEQYDLKQSITQNDTWTVSEGHFEGAPFLLRFRPHLESFIKTNFYNNRVIIIYNYGDTNNTYMPNNTELDRMRHLENSLVEELEFDLNAVLAFVYTGKNKKEWHWYSNDTKLTEKRISKTLTKFVKQPIRITIVDDPLWSEYLEVLKDAKTSEKNTQFK